MHQAHMFWRPLAQEEAPKNEAAKAPKKEAPKAKTPAAVEPKVQKAGSELRFRSSRRTWTMDCLGFPVAYITML